MKYLEIQEITQLFREQKGVMSFSDLANALNRDGILLQKRIQSFMKTGVFKRFCRGVYIDSNPSLSVLGQKINPNSYISLSSALSEYQMIGSSPQTLFSVKQGARRKYQNAGKVLVFLGADNLAKKEIVNIEGSWWASSAQAVVDVLYYYQKGFSFPFDIYSDLSIDSKLVDAIQTLSLNYRNRKFVKFVENFLNECV